MITLSTSKPVSPFGRDLKGTFAALQSLLRTKAINFTLRLATIPFRLRRNIIDLIRGALGWTWLLCPRVYDSCLFQVGTENLPTLQTKN